MIEAVHQLERRMPALVGYDPHDIFDTAPRRLFAKDVQTGFNTRDRYFSRDVIGQADNKHIQFFRKQTPVVSIVASPVSECPFAVKSTVAYRRHAQMLVAIDAVLAASADDAKPGDPDLEF